jgi:peptidoglycan/LPS O-acetylase OafA/YrhL
MLMSLRDDKRTFVTLDGLRGVAAFAVLVRHTLTYNLLFESYLAVDFFFVLSGFVLEHAYGKRLRGEMSPAAFMKVRLIRLYPLYALALALSTVPTLTQYLHGNPPAPGVAIDYAAAILFLPTPASPSLFPLVGPSWSLFFELVANGAFAIFWRRLGNRVLMAVVFGSALVLIAAATTRTF